jgi:uncharacterized membrane protein
MKKALCLVLFITGILGVGFAINIREADGVTLESLLLMAGGLMTYVLGIFIMISEFRNDPKNILGWSRMWLMIILASLGLTCGVASVTWQASAWYNDYASSALTAISLVMFIVVWIRGGRKAEY